MTVVRESHQLGEFASRPEFEDDINDQSDSQGLLGNSTPNNRTSGAKWNTRQMAYLDGLRGFFAYVVYMHFQTPFFLGTDLDVDRGWRAANPEGGENRWLASFPIIRLFFTGGNAAIAIFFVHSGYVLSRSVLLCIRQNQQETCATNLTSALIRQSLHLYLPPIGFSLIQAFSMHLPFGIAPFVSIPQSQPGMIQEILHCIAELVRFLNPFQSHGLYMDQFPYNPVLWTYPVELKGSILVLVIIAFLHYVINPRLGSRVQVPLLGLLATVLLFSYQWSMALFVAGLMLSILDISSEDDTTLPSPFTSKFTPRKVDSKASVSLNTSLLVVGMLLMGQPSRVKNPRRSRNTPGWGILTNLTPEPYYSDEFYRFYQSIGAVVVMYTTLRLGWLQKLFLLMPFQYLGKMAYSLYLVNVPVLWIWGERMQRLLGWKPRTYHGPVWLDGKLNGYPPDIGMPGFSTVLWTVILLTVPVLFFVSNLANKWLDEPSIQFGKLICVKLGCESKSEEVDSSIVVDFEQTLEAREELELQRRD